MLKPETCIHVFYSSFRFESRTDKQAQSILKLPCIRRLIYLGVDRAPQETVEHRSNRWQIHRLRLHTQSLPKNLIGQSVKYLEWCLQVLSFIRREKPLLIQIHSLAPLLIGVLAKLFFGCRIIYDAHEYETEVHGLSGSRKLLAKVAERILIRFCNIVFVVSDSIGQRYRKDYPAAVKPVVIRNMPILCSKKAYPQPPPKGVAQKIRATVGEGSIISAYAGGLSPGRGVEHMLETFEGLDGSSYHLVIFGDGSLGDLARKAASSHQNIHYHTPLPHMDLMAELADCDIGIYFMENTCQNHYLCLPNKFFEYLTAGLPVLVPDFPEMGGFVEANSVGWTFSGGREVAVLRGINRTKIALQMRNVYEIQHKIHWEVDGVKVTRSYAVLTGSSSVRSLNFQE